jgi:hypothetical protein
MPQTLHFFLTGQLVICDDDLTESQLKVEVSKVADCLPYQVRLAPKPDGEPSEFLVWIDPVRVIHVDFPPNRLVGTYSIPATNFLACCTNESIIRKFLPYLRNLPEMWRNPHPLVADAIITQFASNGSLLKMRSPELSSNPSTRIFGEICLPRGPDFFNVYDLCINSNPMAIDFVIDHFHDRLTKVHLYELFRHPYTRSIQFVWDTLAEKEEWSTLANLPGNDHPTAVHLRISHHHQLKPHIIYTLDTENEELLTFSSADFHHLLHKPIAPIVEYLKSQLGIVKAEMNEENDEMKECHVEHLAKYLFLANPHEELVDFFIAHLDRFLDQFHFLAKNPNPRLWPVLMKHLDLMDDRTLTTWIQQNEPHPEIVIWLCQQRTQLVDTIGPTSLFAICKNSENVEFV